MTDADVELYDWERDVAAAEPGATVMVGPAVAVPAQPRRREVFADVRVVEHERRPVIPAVLRNPDDRRALLRHVGGRVVHASAFHAVRLPVYVPRVAGYAARGAWRSGRGFTAWAFDREYAPLRAEAIRTLNMAEARAQYRQRQARVKWRSGVFWSVLAAACVAGGIAYAMLSPAELVALAAGVFIGLAFVGRPTDRPAFSPAVVKPVYRRLTSDMVEAALVAAGLVKVDKDGHHRLGWVHPPARDGAGYLAVVDLPPGITFEQAMSARAAIASGLHVSAARLWLEADKTSERRLRLWCADQAMSDVSMPAWPLLRAGKTDVFGGFPFGIDRRGRVVSMSLMYSNLLVGAVPGMGKSFAARLAGLACALDPTAELHVWDLKGGADWLCFEPVAHAFGAGDQAEDIQALIGDLREIRKEMQRRYLLLQTMARQHDKRAPEGKVTRQLADDPAARMRPLVVVVDELQVLFAKSCPWREEAEELLTDLVKRGRAVGVIAVLSTQRPDKDSIPTGIRDNIATRLALRVLTHIASDMVLGGGMSANGIRAHEFTRADLGVGWLVGATTDADATVVKTFYVDQRGAERIIDRALTLREHAGTITGHAAGNPPTVRSSLLDDVLDVMSGDRQHVEPLAQALTDAWPDQYAGWDTGRLAGALRGQGVHVGQLKVGRINQTGVRRGDVEAARDTRRSA